MNEGDERARAFLQILMDNWAELPTVAALNAQRVNHCILATRAVIETARYFGFSRLAPLAVRVVVWNEPGWARFQAGIPVAEWPPEAWSVGIEGNSPDRHGHWNGHLIVSGYGYLADFNANQMDRPARGLHVNNAMMAQPEADPPWVFSDADNHTYLLMEPLHNIRYRASPDWRQNYKLVAREAITAMKGILKAQLL